MWSCTSLRRLRSRMMGFLSASLVGLAWLLVSNGSAVQNSPDTVHRIGSDRQLFIDDSLIAKSTNVSLTMNPPVKTGEHNIVPERPWETFIVGGWGTVMEDDGLYKMWYEASAFDGTKAEDNLSEEQLHQYLYKHLKRHVSYAVSRDGVHWERPKLGLIDANGSRETNIVLTDTHGTVFLDPRKADGNRFKYTGRIGGGFSLWVWTSPDGIHWKKFLDHPVLRKGPFDSQNQAFWDDRIGKYVAYVRRGSDKLNRADLGTMPYSQVFQLAAEGAADPAGQRKVGRATSDDLVHWPNEPEVVFSYDKNDPVESDHYNPCVIKYPYARDVYLMFPSAFLHASRKETGNDGALDIQLATSRDGIHWNRLDRRPYVRLGVEGSFDSGTVYMMVGMLRRGPELWMYYTGSNLRHGAYDVKTTRNMGIVSRLVQRVDGFISVDAAFMGGELTTVPLSFEGGRLRLNVDTGALGSARVEILDEQGKVVPGFAEADCDLINGNFIDHTVTWKKSSDVTPLAGQAVRLRFVMRSAKLFAFQFVKP